MCPYLPPMLKLTASLSKLFEIILSYEIFRPNSDLAKSLAVNFHVASGRRFNFMVT